MLRTSRTSSPLIIRHDQIPDPSFDYLGDDKDNVLSNILPYGHCLTPDPSCVRSSFLMDWPSIQPGPTPSPCPSVRSDRSMGEPPRFKKENFGLFMRSDVHRVPSPCASLNSERNFSPWILTKLEAASPVPTCVTDLSMYSRQRPGPTPSPCLSVRSDRSMGEPPRFSKENLGLCLSHSFCSSSVWEPSETFYSCTQVKKRLKASPAPDHTLKQAGFSPAQSSTGPSDTACDICTNKRRRAVKWCLTCSAAYCETHVRQHYTSEVLQRYTLTDVMEDLQTRTCQLHHRALEVFCRTDQVFICLICVMEEHKGHDTHLAKAGSHPVETKLREQDQIPISFKKKLKRTWSDLSHLAKCVFRGFEDVTGLNSEYVEVSALGRRLDVGMLYDCRTESLSYDITLWEKNLISSMKLSIPRPQNDIRILDRDTLQDRLAALDLNVSQRASVVSGLLETAGASAFVNHPIQSELQDRVTLHYRASTRLEMLSYELLHGGFPLSVKGLTTATHVVIAVLYGSQAFYVVDKDRRSGSNTDLKDIVKNRQTDLPSWLTDKDRSSLFYDCSVYHDGDVPRRTPQNPGAVPLKVWLYPLKILDHTSACIAKDINKEQLSKAENILEELKMNLSFCQHLMSDDGSRDVFETFPALKDALSDLSSFLQRHQADFQRTLASCIKTVRETGAEEADKNLQDLMDANDRSLFSPQYTYSWLQTKRAQVRALIQCRSANIRILIDRNDLERFVQERQADTVMCFILSSPDGADPFLAALRQDAEPQQAFGNLDISQEILSDLQAFILNKQSVQETVFVAAFVPDLHPPSTAVRLYQSGRLISRNVRPDDKPEPAEIITVRQTGVTAKLQSLKTETDEHYRVEYREVKDNGRPGHTEWTVVSCTREENYVVSGLAPGTRYQLRYTLIDRNGMTDYSRLTEFQTACRPRPGPPTVLRPDKESLYVAWQKAETDEDSPVLCYTVEYLEAGLEGWQSVQTHGPVCECTISLPYSTCYRARVSAVYGPKDVSTTSEETKVPVRVWSIDLSKRKASIFLEVLQLQTTKKFVKLRDCPGEESELQSFLQCLSCVSQLSIEPPRMPRAPLQEWRNRVTLFLINLCLQAAVHQREEIQETLQMLLLRYFKTYQEQSAFILHLYSHMKDYETKTGVNIQPELQGVYQTLPEVWSVNLSEKNASIFLGVLTLQTVKKAVELRGWSEEDHEMRILLQCLPFISQLSFVPLQPERKDPQEHRKRVRRFLLDLCLQAGLHQQDKIQTIIEKCFKTDKETSVFLLLLYSHVRNYETRTGHRVLLALQPVYAALPKIWSVDLSETKASVFLEVLKLQPVKKSVELRGWSEEDSEMRILLQCLPFISQLRFGFVLHEKRRKTSSALRFLVKLIAGVAEFGTEPGQSFTELLASLCSFRTFSFSGHEHEFDNAGRCNTWLDLYSCAKDYEAETGRRVLPALRTVYEELPDVWTTNLSDQKAAVFLEVLKVQTVKKVVELTGWSNEKAKIRSFVQCLPRISQLSLCSDVVTRMARVKSWRTRTPVTLDELLLTKGSAEQPRKTLSSLSFLLRRWKIRCLNLTEYKTAPESLIGLLNHRGPLTVRFSEDTLQKLVTVVYDAQDAELTRSFLQKVGGDLSSCTLSWDLIHCFLQHHPLTLDFRGSQIHQQNIQDLLPLMSKVHLRGLKSSFVLSVMRTLYAMSSAHSVSSLLSLTQHCINLENRKLNSGDCAALRFVLEHCTGVSLNLLWTSVPEGELESIVVLLSRVSHLRVDRLLLLRLLHCCSAPELQQVAAVLLSALHHKLDFSCHDALDLTADTPTDSLFLSSTDCRVISTAIQSTRTHTQLSVLDCEIDEAGPEQLFPVLHTVTLHCRKELLLRFLSLVHVGTEADNTRRAMALTQALTHKLDLSETRLNAEACKSLALLLEYSEELSELDLSHCHITDHELELLVPQLHKARIVDLSHNHITDVSTRSIYHSVNSDVQSVRLFDNRIEDMSLFLTDQRFEIW